MNLTANLGPCTDEQQNRLNLHLAAVRWCYNHALVLEDRMFGKSPKEIKAAFHALKPGSGFEDCSSYVCARARDEARWDWDRYTRGTAPRPELRLEDWKIICWYRYDRPVRVRYGNVKLPRNFGRYRYDLDVDPDLRYTFRYVEIEPTDDPEMWLFRGDAGSSNKHGRRQRRKWRAR